MNKMIEVIGGGLITAAAVLLAIHMFKSAGVESSLNKSAVREVNSYEDYIDEPAFTDAVTKHPVFTYQGAATKKSGTAYDLTEDILLTDSGIDYKDTLKQAKADGIITKITVTVTDSEGNVIDNVTVGETTGEVTFFLPGIYQITVEGSDSDNNQTAVSFFVSVNREKKGA